MRLFLPSFFLLCVFLTFSDGYRILCLFPFNGKSHFVMFSALCRGLARKGHQVDMVSHFPQKKPLPNFTDVLDLSDTMEKLVGSFTLQTIEEFTGPKVILALSTKYGNDVCEVMKHKKMQNFIKDLAKKPRYDIILTEYFASRCFIAFGSLLNAPVGVVSSSQESPFMNEVLANPQNNAIYPNYFMGTGLIKTFYERLFNTLQNVVYSRLFFHFTKPQTDMVQKYLNLNISDINEAEKNISLALVNSHHSMFGVRAKTSAVIEVGGIHVEEDQSEMTPELQKWLDSSTDGVVYFNLGSLMKLESLPKETMLSLYASFAKIAPTRVLMKTANKELLPPGLPENVITLPWVPQIPVLRHRNIRVFITHGGLMGSQEALYHGVPIIGIPLFADQPHNVGIFEEKNMGVKLDYRKLTTEKMDAALNALLKDPKYKKAAERESALFKDRPMTAMDTAIFWIEYVIRNGPNVLKSPAVDMPWWQTNLFDVYAFLLISFIILLYLSAILLKTFVGIIRKMLSPKSSRSKKYN